MNNRGPVAKIIERDGWKCRMDFAGHRKAITVVVRIIKQFLCMLRHLNKLTRSVLSDEI